MMAYSCSLIPKQVDVISKPLERTIAQPVMPREINLSESEFRQLRSNYFNREMKLHSEKLMMELYGQSTIRYSN